MIRFQIGEKGTVVLKVLEITRDNKGTIDFYYQDMNEPPFMSNFWISLSDCGSDWEITDFCVYYSKEQVYKDVKGLFSTLLTDKLIEALLSYYHVNEKKKALPYKDGRQII